MASRRLVLPWPLRPTTMLTRSWNAISSRSRFRKFCGVSDRRITQVPVGYGCRGVTEDPSSLRSSGLSEPHRHHDVEVFVRQIGLDRRRPPDALAVLVLEVERDARRVDGAQKVRHVRRVEADEERIT